MKQYLCPFCIDEVECVGPHIPQEYEEQFKEYTQWYYGIGFKHGQEQSKRLEEMASE